MTATDKGHMQNKNHSSLRPRHGLSSSAGGYVPLEAAIERESQRRDYDPRFEMPPPEFPYSSVVLAIFLILFGICSFIFAWMHWTQKLIGKEQAEIGLTVLGILTFLPGYYHCRIAYYTWRGYSGYSYDTIPRY